ncbi:MAG: ferritin-like domain-containing protein [Robiginitomaculum sp.]|nr:ferritin-like domain-containing protein [Robiginitomaculum sp.]
MQSVSRAACEVLTAKLPADKVQAAHALRTLWNTGKLEIFVDTQCVVPTNPGRPDTPHLVEPSELKRRRLGSVHGRSALLHAIAHIEFNAIDLAADMVARYSNDTRISDQQRHEFISDWIGVCDDEARHFGMVNTRLQELGSFYGENSAHNGLWEAALSTMDDLAARLVIAPMVLEARGLDVTPNMIKKLENVGDNKSADILKIIYEDEIGHVAAGVKWFFYLCEHENREKKAYFKELLALHFRGSLKPPFNEKARKMAGLPDDFYLG